MIKFKVSKIKKNKKEYCLLEVSIFKIKFSLITFGLKKVSARIGIEWGWD